MNCNFHVINVMNHHIVGTRNATRRYRNPEGPCMDLFAAFLESLLRLPSPGEDLSIIFSSIPDSAVMLLLGVTLVVIGLIIRRRLTRSESSKESL